MSFYFIFLVDQLSRFLTYDWSEYALWCLSFYLSFFYDWCTRDIASDCAAESILHLMKTQKAYEFLVGDSLGVGTKRLPRIMNLILIFFSVGTQSFCQCSSVGILNVGFGGEWS